MPELTGGQAAVLSTLVDQQDVGRTAITAGLRTALLTTWRQFLLSGAESVRARTQKRAKASARAALSSRFVVTSAQAAVLYQEDDVFSLAERLAAQAQDAQRQAFNLQREFQRRYLATLGVQARPLAGDVPVGRLGVEPTEVYLRPAVTFRYERSVDTPVETALERAEERLIRLSEDDVMLASRDGAMDVISDPKLPISGYRRILRPELAKTGSCGFCIVAADRIYTRAELLPLHGRCHCLVAPIVGDIDPGRQLNGDDLEALYKAAGASSGSRSSTNARDLKKVRVVVDEHGELGPVLVRQGAKLLTPEEALERGRSKSDRPATSRLPEHSRSQPLTSNPQWVQGQLAGFEQRLKELEARAAAGEDVTSPLAYHRTQVERFRKLAAALR